MAVLSVRCRSERLTLDLGEGVPVRVALDGTALRVRAACGGVGSCGACRVRVTGGQVAAPTLAERAHLGDDELAWGVRLACQLHCLGDTDLDLDDPAPPSCWRSLPEDQLGPVVAPPNQEAEYPLGVAVDLGTSHLRVALWNLRQGRRVATRWGTNPQSAWGADVLNRLAAAETSPGQGKDMAAQVRAALQEAIGDMLARDLGEGASLLPEIGRVVLAGNTAMLALLTGQGGSALLDPANWQGRVEVLPGDPSAWAAEWRLPNAEFRILPPLGGFVGSDLLAAVVASRLLEGPAGSLLLDVGTNTELALWDGAVLHVAAVPGGPAFEVAGTRNGVAAGPGAIARVIPLANGAGYACATADGTEVRGFCGSGLVDAVALLRAAGVLRHSGRFVEPAGPGGHRLDPAVPASAIRAGDVDALQRAKAALAAAMETLLDRACLDWNGIRRLCLCGAFGHGLDLDHARELGLLPALPAERIERAPHAALAGCERALVDPLMESDFSRVAHAVQLINLSCIEGWEDRYMAHLRLVPIPLEAEPPRPPQ